jgi:hypothetical protein
MTLPCVDAHAQKAQVFVAAGLRRANLVRWVALLAGGPPLQPPPRVLLCVLRCSECWAGQHIAGVLVRWWLHKLHRAQLYSPVLAQLYSPVLAAVAAVTVA